MSRRRAGVLPGLLAAAALAAVVLWRVIPNVSGGAHSAASKPPPPVAAPAPPAAPPAAPSANPVIASSAAPPAPSSASCDGGSPATRANQTSLTNLAWSPFGRPESGWATYAPLVAREIGTACPPDSAGFARDYARWQARMKVTADGVFKPGDFERLRAMLMLRRPFVQLTSKGACPVSPDPSTLAAARPDEAYGGKLIQLRPGALAAYRRMVAAARAQGLARQAPLLQLVSGYRGPAEEAARCEDGSCNTLTRANCSAHRTGLALDLYLPPAMGHDPVSTAEDDRRHMTASPEYRWLVANAGSFGFLPYPFEPWHWAWTGDAP